MSLYCSHLAAWHTAEGNFLLLRGTSYFSELHDAEQPENKKKGHQARDAAQEANTLL